MLTRERLPATVFLVAQTLTEEGQPVDWVDTPGTEPLSTLTRDQVLEMQDAGVDFQSHSWAHHVLTQLSEHECRKDLRDSREFLAEVLGRPVTLLAYPRGRHSPHVRRAAAAAVAALSLFGGKSGPTAQSLGTTSARYDAAGNLLDATGSGWMGRNASSDAFVQGLQSQYAASIAALGGTASGTSFFYGSGQQSDGTGALRRIAGGAGSSYFNSGEIGADAEVTGGLRTVNGAIRVGAGARVRDLATVNGNVDLAEARGGDLAAAVDEHGGGAAADPVDVAHQPVAVERDGEAPALLAHQPGGVVLVRADDDSDPAHAGRLQARLLDAVELRPAVAAAAAEDVAGQALRVHPGEDRDVGTEGGRVAVHERDVLGRIDVVLVPDDAELAEGRREPRLGDAVHQPLVRQPVGDELRHRDEGEAVLPGDPLEILAARHRAVGVREVVVGDAADPLRTMTPSAVEGLQVVTGYLEHLLTAIDELPVEVSGGIGLTPGFVHPVERQAEEERRDDVGRVVEVGGGADLRLAQGLDGPEEAEVQHVDGCNTGSRALQGSPVRARLATA